jgi:nucleoside diphosphate kinase
MLLYIDMNRLPIASTASADASRVDFGYAMVKPDGLEIGLDEPIIERIENAGLTVIKRSLACITGNQIDGLYPTLHDRPFYESMKQAMVGRRVLSLIIAGDAGVGRQLLAIKGSSAHASGTLRADFSAGHLLDGEIRHRYLTGTLIPEDELSDEWKVVLRDDRVHSDETPEEAANSIRTMFTQHDLSEVSNRHSQFLDFLKSGSDTR